MQLLEQLLPNSTHLQLLSWHLDEAERQITLNVSSKQTVVPCPVCAFPTHRIHSHYERCLADLSWAEHRVSWQLQVRKYFCLNPAVSAAHLYRTATRNCSALGTADAETSRTTECDWLSSGRCAWGQVKPTFRADN